MKRTWAFMCATASLLSLLCACGKAGGTAPGGVTTPISQEQQATPGQESQETAEEMFGYRYTFPVENATHYTKSDGAFYKLESCDLFIYKNNYLKFSSWEETVEQCKEEMAGAIYDVFKFWPAEQTVAATTSSTNPHGVSMMRVNGELEVQLEDRKVPYVAYYYVTDDNHIRFMIALNYEDEAKAAEVIDFVAKRLEKV